MSEVIVITSGKGGVGKTTTCNVENMDHSPWKKVRLIDTDIGLEKPGRCHGTGNRIVYNLVRCCRRKLPHEACVPIRDKKISKPLPSARSADTEQSAVTLSRCIKPTDDLKDDFDYSIVRLSCVQDRTRVLQCHCRCRLCTGSHHTGSFLLSGMQTASSVC